MTVNNIIQLFDLSNIETFKVNGKIISLIGLRSHFGESICKQIQINTLIKELNKDNIHYDIISDEFDTVQAFVEMRIPNNASFVSIELNFTI